MALTTFDPAPAADALPARLTNPFGEGPPHPLARRAAEALMAELRAGALAGVDLAGLDAPGRGKMFGVLVVVGPDGRAGWLRAFSGMLDGRWQVDGFSTPLFDAVARDAVWVAGEAEMRAYEARHRQLADGAAISGLRAELAALDAGHAAERAALRAGGDGEAGRGHRRDRRRALAATQRAAREPVLARLAAIDAERVELERVRAARSRQLLVQIVDTYAIPDARGERRSLWSLYAPDAPPGGAGDCAAPKLLAEAFAAGLRPLALAEFWWGAPPLTGGREAGAYYPACAKKCGGVLPFMLAGTPVDGEVAPGAGAILADAPRVVFEDDALLIVDKPAGLLAEPGRHDPRRDSALVRLCARYPAPVTPLLVHALEVEISGLLLLAKDAATHAALAHALALGAIERRHVAWLDGEVAGERGVVDLPLRLDFDHRPRRLHDPQHGKRALTEWQVLARAAGRTRVALTPRTARTHQLRVHAAHPLGLGAAIAGDRLYGGGGGGGAGARLLLHADRLAFSHPRTGQPIAIACPAPF